MSYRRSLVRGLGWLGSLQALSAGVSQVAGIALATLLGPSDFGLFGLAMIAIALVAIPGDLGLTVEVIRRDEVENILPTAIRLRWLIALFLTGFALIIASAFAFLFSMPSFLWLVAALSTIFPAAAFSFGSRAALTRALNFRSLAVADTAGRLIGPVSAVCFAVIGFGFWSLALGLLVSTWTSAFSVCLIMRVKTKKEFRLDIAKALVSSGKFVSIATVFGFLLVTADNAAVAGAFGIAALGIYSFSYSLAVTVPRNASSLVETVLFPVFSRLNKDPERLGRGYAVTIRYVAYFLFPVAAAIAVLSPSFVSIILGARWSGTAPVMQVLSVGGLAFALSVPASSALLAMGEARLVTKSNAYGALALLIGLAGAIFYKAFLSVAVAAVAAALVYFCSLTRLVGRLVGVRWQEVARVVSKPIFASAMAAVGMSTVLFVFPPGLVSLLIATVLGVVGYICILEATSGGEFSASMKQISAMVIR
ncbi:MAG TPA: oligosaccharide flippase family protein [Thermoplasmata archaeon]